jgi:hypothetical protein
MTPTPCFENPRRLASIARRYTYRGVFNPPTTDYSEQELVALLLRDQRKRSLWRPQVECLFEICDAEDL